MGSSRIKQSTTRPLVTRTTTVSKPSTRIPPIEEVPVKKKLRKIRLPATGGYDLDHAYVDKLVEDIFHDTVEDILRDEDMVRKRDLLMHKTKEFLQDFADDEIDILPKPIKLRRKTPEKELPSIESDYIEYEPDYYLQQYVEPVDEYELRVCPVCDTSVSSSLDFCPVCKYDFPNDYETGVIEEFEPYERSFFEGRDIQ